MKQLVEVFDTTGRSQARKIQIVLDLHIEFDPHTYEYIVHIPEQRYKEIAELADRTCRIV